VAARHEINTGRIYTRRRLLFEGGLGGQKPAAPTFAPVNMASEIAALRGPAPISAAPTPTEVEPTHRSGVIEIEFVSGVRVRVDGNVNCKALKRVLDAL
jgi:hypothetical protein